MWYIRLPIWAHQTDLRQKWRKDSSSNEDHGGKRGGGEQKKYFKIARLLSKTMVSGRVIKAQISFFVSIFIYVFIYFTLVFWFKYSCLHF